ncbi:MAG: cobalt-precorrin-5B (C(1))-methyltransferase [Hyphomicrobiaceae bacterium]|nr:cobalt-precorrin-5B (C(1))-methyltransferase [Hyphomicrobiaceae bacterium]
MTATENRESRALRRGWTTGACATAATRAAVTALLTGRFPDPVSITLPKGEQPAFPLAFEETGETWARAGIVKDAGDDPDVTHGAVIVSTVRRCRSGAGIVFRAGEGVGTVTKPGLPLAPGEPAINPVPRRMMREMIEEIAAENGAPGDFEVEISVPGGAALAEKTWNPRLGIEGGISILGTTGVVHPFSCSAWIHSIHRGIDVARATGISHIAGATGSTSEAAVADLYNLDTQALIDMGDFVGGMLKYVRSHPVDRVTVAGGFAKMTKLGQGRLDLHSGRSQVDFDWLAERVREAGGSEELSEKAHRANTALEVLEVAMADGVDVAGAVADRALETVKATLRDAPVVADVVIVDRQGKVIARAA